MDGVDMYIESLLKQAGMDTLPSEIYDDQKERLTQQLQGRIGAVILSKMTPEAGEKYAKLANDPELTEEKMKSFLDEHLPQYQQILKDALDEFSREFFSGLNQN